MPAIQAAFAIIVFHDSGIVTQDIQGEAGLIKRDTVPPKRTQIMVTT
jgi:hypothetical protein